MYDKQLKFHNISLKTFLRKMVFSSSFIALSGKDEGFHAKFWFEVKCIINILIISLITLWSICALYFECCWKSSNVVISFIWNNILGGDSVALLHVFRMFGFINTDRPQSNSANVFIKYAINSSYVSEKVWHYVWYSHESDNLTRSFKKINRYFGLIFNFLSIAGFVWSIP